MSNLAQNRCIVSNFYIKSQLFAPRMTYNACCIVSNFYIKSQLSASAYASYFSCIVSNFYIKSQLINLSYSVQKVVQYPISTSNHNWRSLTYQSLRLYSIQFLHQITTRNVKPDYLTQLYSIQFLHQITTSRTCSMSGGTLYSIQFLHQITTNSLSGSC